MVVGATIRGLVAAYVLSVLGYRAVVVERSANIGGADGSFRTAGGDLFDHGLHVLDAGRSGSTTALFAAVLAGAVHRTVLRRGIVLRGHVMPYAPMPEDMPGELGRMLATGSLVDDIGDALPTQERLAACYGREYVDVIFDEVLPSFPSEYRHREFGVDEARLLTNVYPWFFPRAERPVPSVHESRAFHDRLRAGVPQEVLYPQAGGFGGFVHGFASKLDPARVELLLGAGAVHVELEPNTHRVAFVEAGARRLRARHYFWAEGWAPLCRLLGLECQDAATDQVVLGSFRLDRSARTDFHELLVGDPRFRLNRVSFPAAFRHDDEPLVQVEFAYPVHDERWVMEPDDWRDRWLDDLRRIGVLDATHRVDDFDFRAFGVHFNGYGAEGAELRDADPSLLAPDTNLLPLAPSMANLNINRYVPRVVRDVTAVMTTS